MSSILKNMKQPVQPIVEFFYDLQCPWAYIASRRIEQIIKRTNAQIIWTPVLLGEIYETIKAQGKAENSIDVIVPAKAQYLSKHLSRTFYRYNIEFNFHPRHPIKTVDALRLLHATPQSHRAVLTHAFYRLYWVDNADISDLSLLLNTAKSLKIPYNEPLDSSIFSNKTYHNLLSSSAARVVEYGAPGVPSFWLEQYPGGGRIYWGQDRLHFVEAALTSISTGVPLEQRNDLLKFYPRCSVKNKSENYDKNVKTLKFWFEYSSSFSYFAYTQLEWIKNHVNCEVKVEYIPIHLGILFDRIGTPQTPLLKLNEVKKAYMNREMDEWMQFWNQVGNKFKFRFPDVFPIRSVNASRILLLEPKTLDCIQKACWVENIPIGTSDDILIETLNKSGFDGNALFQAVQKNVNNVKDKLKENTEQAIKLGIHGMPIFQVDDGELIWGQDNINIVLDLLDGWTWQDKGISEPTKNSDEKAKL